MTDTSRSNTRTITFAGICLIVDPQAGYIAVLHPTLGPFSAECWRGNMGIPAPGAGLGGRINRRRWAVSSQTAENRGDTKHGQPEYQKLERAAEPHLWGMRQAGMDRRSVRGGERRNDGANSSQPS